MIALDETMDCLKRLHRELSNSGHGKESRCRTVKFGVSRSKVAAMFL
jgi:hypothetical protein